VTRRLPPVLMALPVLAVMLAGMGAPLGGSHVFRQSHVAANIDKFVEDGLSLRPSTYNEDVPFSAFDFPLYQIGVASVCRLVPVEALQAARATSWLLLVVALLVLDRLLKQAGVRRWPRVATLLLFACAPLNLFYFQAPMVDDLAVLLALVSLQQHVAAVRDRGNPLARWSVLLFGFLSTLIKSPVYLPVFVALLWHRARTRGLRALARADAIAYAGVTALGVVCFKVYWAVVNGSSGVLTAWERQHYFGSLSGRLSPAAWHPVLSDLLSYTTNPAIAVFAVGGVVWWTRRRRGPAAPVFPGLLVGCGVTLLVFFDLYPPHNYYQLPFVLPVAFFGAQGLEGLRVVARAGRRRTRPWWRPALAAVVVAVLATGFWSWTGFRELATSSRATEVLRARGEWVRARTEPQDYVIYVYAGAPNNWTPAYLYFARRDGRNLLAAETTPARVAAIAAEAYGRFPRVLLFTVQPDVARALRDAGAEALVSDRRRSLLRVDGALVAGTLSATGESAPGRPGGPSRGRREDRGTGWARSTPGASAVGDPPHPAAPSGSPDRTAPDRRG